MGTLIDSANFLTLAGRLVRDAIARGVLNQETGRAFIDTAHNLVRYGATVSTGSVVEMTAADPSFSEEATRTIPIDQSPVYEQATGDTKQARANALARRIRGAE